MRNLFLGLLFLLTPVLIFAQKEEMRGAWIATAKNIDFPSSKYLSSAEQKQEFTEMLDLFADIGINAVMVQVRPAADAFFPSEFEPWSEWLTGKQGKAPDPYYDPMQFMIDECHKRNIQFHAWINPFRAVANIETADITANHISNRKPEWVFTYDINKYFNPGIPEVRNYIIRIITDIVKRYDLDGVHFDDYFYPYPKKDDNKKIIPIPDFDTYKRYGKNFNNIENWRRYNMNVFIRSVNDSIKSVKPYMVFGVSPSGVWRNKSRDPAGSATRGFAHYDFLYADVRKWLRKGWIDYVAPQLYWSIGHTYADYKTLVNWWSRNTYGRKLYIGHGVYNAGAKAKDLQWRKPSQLPDQIRINRSNPNVHGSIFYKASSIKQNLLGWNDTLKQEFYADAAIPPRCDWLPLPPGVVDTTEIHPVDTQAPLPPFNLDAEPFGREIILTWLPPKVSGVAPDDAPVSYKVYRFRKGERQVLSDKNLVATSKTDYFAIQRKRFALFKKRYVYFVTSVDKAGNESTKGAGIELKLKLRE